MAAEVAQTEPATGEGPGAQRARLFENPGSSLPNSLLAILGLILAGLALRVLRLEFQPLWWDEGYSAWFATQPLGQIAALTSLDIHPPLYYALLHGWTLLAGTRPVALRLFSVAAGTLTIPAIYVAGRQMLGRRGAWLAALLLALNPLHVFYSQEVRMYGLVALLSLGSLMAAWRLLHGPVATASGHRAGTEQNVHGAADSAAHASPRRGPPAGAMLLYVALTTAALYTQYYAAFLPLGLTIYAAWRWRGNVRALAAWLGLQAMIALLYAPWLLYATPKLIPYISNKVRQDADQPLSLFAYLGRHLSAFTAGHLEGPLAPYWPVALAPLGLWLVWLAVRRVGRGARSGPAARTGASDTPEVLTSGVRSDAGSGARSGARSGGQASRT